MRLNAFFAKEPWLIPAVFLLAIIWLVPHTSLPDHVKGQVKQHIEKLPKVKVDWRPSVTFKNRFSNNKTALYIETSNDVRHVTPLLLHMTQVVPPEWRFLFIGSEEQIERVNRSAPAKLMQQIGKLRLQNVEEYTHRMEKKAKELSRKEIRNRLLTNLTFYDEQLPGVEWLFLFKSTSILCANSNETVNDYLDYSWVGAPWGKDDKFGGNGGLSLRRLSKVREILSFQKRIDNDEDEDKWLSKRVGLLPNSNNANASVETRFSIEQFWTDKPMGYVVPSDQKPGMNVDVWEPQDKRREIYKYCPEIKMILPMELERLKCPEPTPDEIPSEDDHKDEHKEGQDLAPTGELGSGTHYDGSSSDENDKEESKSEGDQSEDGDKEADKTTDDSSESESKDGEDKADSSKDESQDEHADKHDGSENEGTENETTKTDESKGEDSNNSSDDKSAADDSGDSNSDGDSKEEQSTNHDDIKDIKKAPKKRPLKTLKDRPLKNAKAPGSKSDEETQQEAT